MLNSAMCLPPTLNFFPCPRGTLWISATFRNTATAHLLKRTLLASCTAKLWPSSGIASVLSFMWLLNLKTIVLELLMSIVATAVVSELYLGCRFVGQFLKLALCLKKYSGCNLPAYDGSVNRRCQANGLRLLLDPTASAYTRDTRSFFSTQVATAFTRGNQFIRAPAAGCCNGSSE